MRAITRIESPDEAGCVPACLAMVLGRPYREIADDFLVDFTVDGVPFRTTIDYLEREGCSTIHKQIVGGGHRFARKELSRPFAPVHIVQVSHFIDADCDHAIVMTARGRIIDPGRNNYTSLDYFYAVNQTVGIWI